MMMTSPAILRKESNIWMHRISHCNEYSRNILGGKNGEFTDDSCAYLSIGWRDIAEKFQKHPEQAKAEAFHEVYAQLYGVLHRTRWSLYRFLYEFQIGDYVVIPDGREFHIVEITGEALTSEQLGDSCEWKTALQAQGTDLGFFRKVRYVRINLPRYSYADSALTARLKYRGSNCCINDIRASVESSCAAKSPVSLYGEVITVLSGTLLNAIREITTPDKLEKLILWYFRKLGADSVVIPSKSAAYKPQNGDADVIADFYDLKLRIYVQAKAFTGTADLNHAREQITVYLENAENKEDEYTYLPWIICTSDKNDILDNVQEGMRYDERIRLISGEEFAEMLLKAGLKSLDEAF